MRKRFKLEIEWWDNLNYEFTPDDEDILYRFAKRHIGERMKDEYQEGELYFVLDNGEHCNGYWILSNE